MPAIYAGLSAAERACARAEAPDRARPRRPPRPPAEPALRRPAAARVDRARADERRPGHPGRRADRRARQQERRRGDGAAPASCSARRPHHHPDHARPRRSREHAQRASSRSRTARSSRDTGPSIATADARRRGRATRRRAEPAPRCCRTSARPSKMAMRALRANLFRTVLTLLGIVIGVGSVVAMLAIGDGAKQAVLDAHQRDGHQPAAGAAGRAERARRRRHRDARRRRMPKRSRRCPTSSRRCRSCPATVTLRYRQHRLSDAGRTRRRPQLPDGARAGRWRSGIFFTEEDLRELRPGGGARADGREQSVPDGVDPIGKLRSASTTCRSR